MAPREKFNQRGCDQRRQAAGNRRSELVADRGPGVAQARAEQFGYQGSLYAVKQGMTARQRKNYSQANPERRPCLQQPVVGKGEADQKETTQSIKALP